ncbi:MAG: T9SS type A sorting domain-containing protein, partial [Chitinophagaceae bacterium]
GIHYYRLKMVDNDGKIIYSKIITLRRSENNNAGISLFPNPATKNPVLSIKSAENAQASIAVLNMQGALLSLESKTIKTGDNAILLQSVNKLSAGIYNVRVLMNGKTYFTRMILQ